MLSTFRSNIFHFMFRNFLRPSCKILALRAVPLIEIYYKPVLLKQICSSRRDRDWVLGLKERFTFLLKIPRLDFGVLLSDSKTRPAFRVTRSFCGIYHYVSFLRDFYGIAFWRVMYHVVGSSGLRTSTLRVSHMLWFGPI